MGDWVTRGGAMGGGCRLSAGSPLPPAPPLDTPAQCAKRQSVAPSGALMPTPTAE